MLLLLLTAIASAPLGVTACGGTFTSPTGVLQSPGFPDGYSNNKDCIYIIKRPAGERITVTFEHLDLQDGDECPFDYVEILDGDTPKSPLLKRVCNTTLPSPTRSFKNSMWIHFRSDFSVTGRGFRASYTSGVNDVFSLITGTRKIILMDMETRTQRSIPGLTVISPIAVDYDPVGGHVYWTDVSLKHIGQASLQGHGSKIIRKLNSVAVPDGMAVDPVSRLVFYSDTGNDIIAVMTMTGSLHRTVIKIGLDEPRDIVLDTKNGVMFWTDWGKVAKIERANYDGTHRKTLHKTFLKLPNAVALDLQNNRLYWVDAGTDFVEYSDLDGNGRTQVWTLQGTHFFGLAYFDDHLFVTDWTGAMSETKTSRIVQLSTDGENGEVIGSTQFRMNDIHIHNEDSWQKGPNGCSSNNGGCSHICIPSPTQTYKCICPDAPTSCIEEFKATYETSKEPETSTSPSPTATGQSTPPSQTVLLSGPLSFDTDGSKEMTLTCDPDEPKVETSVTWSVTCERKEGRTCIWKPQPPKHDGKVVTCSVTYSNGQSGVGSFKVQLNYPPTAPPEIQGYKTGDVLRAGDALTMTCLVRGGKPLVASVTFFCVGHPDGINVRGEHEAQSILLINPVTTEDNGKRCVCTAEWKNGDLYALCATRILKVQGDERGQRTAANRLEPDESSNCKAGQSSGYQDNENPAIAIQQTSGAVKDTRQTSSIDDVGTNSEVCDGEDRSGHLKPGKPADGDLRVEHEGH